MSRPSSYDPKYCDVAVKFQAEGYSLTALAGKIGIASSTFFEWVKKYPDFAEAVDLGKPKAVLYWETELHDFAKTGKGNATAIVFGLKNRASSEWSDKIVNEHTGKDGGAIEIASLSSAERARALAAFLAKTKAEK